MKNYLKPILISISCYLIFFYPLLDRETVIYSGKDSSSFHYPSRVYLYEKLRNREFPFWTERLFLGFPIYADLERGYLNPINLILVYLAGPIMSYKIIHFTTYLVGSLSLYILLKKFGHNTLGFLLANLIYFFSFFMLYHQQHFNAVQTLYLLPLLILLTYNFLNTGVRKYMVFTSLLVTYTFYLGNMQYVLLLLLAQLFWIIADKKQIKRLLYLLVFQYSLIFILCLPGLISVFSLYVQSMRITELRIYNQGSFFPLMFINAVVPFLFGRGNDYVGILISNEYFMHEIYIYIGVVSLVVSVIIYTNTKNKQLKIFATLCVILFLILSIIKFIPLLNTHLIPPFSLFRYWIRSISLITFVVALFVSEFISAKSINIIFQKRQQIYALLCIAFLLVVELINYENGKAATFFRVFLRDDFKFNFTFIIWLTILVCAFVVLILYLKKKVDYAFLKNSISFLIILESITFGLIIMSTAFINVSDILPNQTPNSYKNARVIDFLNNINGNNSLYFKTWSPFGYSVFAPTDVFNKLTGAGFKETRYLELNGDLNLEKIFELGVSKVITASRTVVSNQTGPFPIKGLSEGINIIKISEQEYIFNINSADMLKIETYLRFDGDWQIYVDNTQTNLYNKNGFVSFDINSGDHLVKIKYVPMRLYYGVALSFIMLIPFTIWYKSQAVASRFGVR